MVCVVFGAETERASPLFFISADRHHRALKHNEDEDTPHTCLESWNSIDDRIYARLRAARMRNAVARQHQPIRQITVIVANVHVPPTAVA